MKPCTQFHWWDLEPGDRASLEHSSGSCEVTVARTYDTRHFGPVVQADDGVLYYLWDYDSTRLLS